MLLKRLLKCCWASPVPDLAQSTERPANAATISLPAEAGYGKGYCMHTAAPLYTYRGMQVLPAMGWLKRSPAAVLPVLLLLLLLLAARCVFQ